MTINKSKEKTNLLKNLFAMALLQGSNFLVPIVTLPHLSRTLGVHSFGIYSFSLAVMVAFGVLVEWGFPLNATANVAEARHDAKRRTVMLNSTVAAKIFLVSLCAGALALLCALVPAFHDASSVLWSAFGLVIAYAFNLGWYLQGLERMSLFAIGALCARLTTVPAILLLVQAPDQAWLAAFIQSGASLLGAAFSIAMVARSGELNVQFPSIDEVRTRIIEAKHFFLAAAAINLYTASTVVIMGVICDPRIVAIYAGADRIKSAAQNVLAPLSQVFYPKIVHLFRTDRKKAEYLLQNLIWLFGAVGLCATLSLEYFADAVVRLLLGERFLAAASVLRILAPIPLISALSNVLSVQAMVPLGLAATRSRILISVMLISLPSTLFFSWLFNGYGAASVVLACEIIGLISFFSVIRSKIRVFKNPRKFWSR